MRLVNKRWTYRDQPELLCNLHPFGEGYLYPILVFCELTNSRSKRTKGTRVGRHFVSGRIGLFQSNQYLGANVGTRGLFKLPEKKSTFTLEERRKVYCAWLWLKDHHPLIKNVDMDHPSDLMDGTESIVIQDAVSSGRENVTATEFQAFHMAPVGTEGPRTADESSNLNDTAIGIQGRDQKLVKYSNPFLLGYLFPTLYPRGRLDYNSIDADQNREIEYLESGGKCVCT